MLGRVLDDSYPLEVRTHITLLTAARTCANACYRFTPPFLATIARGVDASLDDLGIALAISEVSGLLSPLTGRLIDRVPRRTGLTVGLVGVAAGTTIAAASPSLVVFAIGLVVLSQSKVMFDLGLGAWLADHVPYERRSRVVGLTETSWAFGLLIGVSLMGLVTAVTDWRVGYGVGAAAVLVLAGLVARGLPAEPRRVGDATAAVAISTRVGRRGWLVVLGGLSLMAASQCLFVTFGAWLEDSFDFTAATIAAVVFGLGLGELLASITSAQRTDRWGKEWSVAAGAGLMAPASIGLAVFHDHLALGLACLAIAISGFEFAIVSALAIGGQLVPSSPARGIGLLVGAGTLGRAIASVPATRLYARSGIGWPAVLCAGFAAACAVAMLASRRAATAQPR